MCARPQRNNCTGIAHQSGAFFRVQRCATVITDEVAADFWVERKCVKCFSCLTSGSTGRRSPHLPLWELGCMTIRVSYYAMCIFFKRSSATRRDSARCVNGHSRSFKIICCCVNRRGIYDFLLALNSNLSTIFNHSWDITRSLHIIPHLSSRCMEVRKDSWEYVNMFWCQGAQNIGLSNYKLKSALKCTVWSQCTPVPDRQTDRETDGQTSCQ